MEDARRILVTEMSESMDPNHVKIVIPQPTNGQPIILPQTSTSHRPSGSPKPANKKPAFNRAFKQAVFQNRGREDGSSNLRVTFTSNSSKSHDGKLLLPKSTQEVKSFPKSVQPVTALKPIKPKPVVIPCRDVIAIDKKKMQEEIDSTPKPDHLAAAEKELLSYASLKTFVLELRAEKEYKCVGCEDVYPSEFSLTDHLSRQSYQLTLDCPCCDTKVTFTNKCQMYQHLQCEHSMSQEKSGHVALSRTSLQVLPRSPVKPASDFPSLPTSCNQHVSGELNGDVKQELSEGMLPTDAAGSDTLSADQMFQKNGEEKSGDVEVKQKGGSSEQEDVKPIIINGAEECDSDEADSSVVCTECSGTFETEWTLQTHFSLPNEQFQPEVCIPCRVELVTPCARKAHMRVHGLTEPYVCPDCGQLMYKKAVFLKHLRLHCFHYSKLSEYTCPSCSDTFNSAEEQLTHLKLNSSHLRFEGERSYYKCNGCPKAFKSVSAHSKHDSCPGAGCTVVHMCNNCPQQTVFRSWAELMEHRSQAHPDLSWKPLRSTRYSCYLCAHKSKSKQGLLDHLLKAHSKKKVDYMCQLCGSEHDCRQSLLVHRESCSLKSIARGNLVTAASLKLPPVTHATSDSTTTSSTHTASDSTTTSSTHNSADPHTADSVLSDSSSAAGDREAPPTKKKKLENISYLSHVTSFNCHMCTAQFSSYDRLRDHVIRRHEGRGLIYECWLCKDKGNTCNFYRQSALDKHMADVHKVQIASPVPPDDTMTAGSEVEVSEVKRMKIWGDESQHYQCCRCAYSSLQVDEFKQHIKQHKATVDSCQCAECGMCFTVQLALKRHLFAVHKVTDYAKYSRLQYMAEYEKQLHDIQGKCPICKKEFNEEVLLRKHLRTHGMMYINTRRMLAT